MQYLHWNQKCLLQFKIKFLQMNILCVILILHSLTQLYESSVSPRLLSLWALVPWDTVKEKKFSMVTKLVKLCIWGGSVGKIFCHSHISGSCPQTTASKGQQEHSPQPMCQTAKKKQAFRWFRWAAGWGPWLWIVGCSPREPWDAVTRGLSPPGKQNGTLRATGHLETQEVKQERQ